MRLNELYPFDEERKSRKRVGRGGGSGLGGTSGKGHKGARSRSGYSAKAGFEGGQMPLARRLPKHGFKNPFRVEYAPVNLSRIAEAFQGAAEVSLEDMYARGLCPRGTAVKVLGNGELAAAMTIEAHRFSKSALEKIAKAGGTAKALEG